MLTIYKSINPGSNLKPFEISGFSRKNDVAQLTLNIIREYEETTRQLVRQQLFENQGIINYSFGKIDVALRTIPEILQQQTLIEIRRETPQQYLTNDILNYQQFFNYRGYLARSASSHSCFKYLIITLFISTLNSAIKLGFRVFIFKYLDYNIT